MKDEIKEILDYFRKYATIRENTMISEIEDYIIDLQEENKKLKFAMQDTYDSANDTCGELQQRIDKAIEYIEKVKYFALVDKINILSISNLEKILRGEENGRND